MHKERVDHHTVAEAADMPIGHTVHATLRALVVVTTQTHVTVVAAVVVQSPADAVAHLDVLYRIANLRNDADALMAKNNVASEEVKVRATNARVRNFNHDLVRLQVDSVALGLYHLAARAALVYGAKADFRKCDRSSHGKYAESAVRPCAAQCRTTWQIGLGDIYISCYCR